MCWIIKQLSCSILRNIPWGNIVTCCPLDSFSLSDLTGFLFLPSVDYFGSKQSKIKKARQQARMTVRRTENSTRQRHDRIQTWQLFRRNSCSEFTQYFTFILDSIMSLSRYVFQFYVVSALLTVFCISAQYDPAPHSVSRYIPFPTLDPEWSRTRFAVA